MAQSKDGASLPSQYCAFSEVRKAQTCFLLARSNHEHHYEDENDRE